MTGSAPGSNRDPCNAATMPDYTRNTSTNLQDLPEHLHRLSAPMQVWDYIWFLQRRVRELEAKTDA